MTKHLCLFAALLLLAVTTSCSRVLSKASLSGTAGFAQAFQRQALEAADVELDAAMLASQMKSVCPISAGPGVTLVNVTHGPGNQVNYYYELPADTDTTHHVPERKRFAREVAIKMFHQQGLAKITEKSDIVWNFVYRKPNGQHIFDLKIGPDDLRAGGNTSATSLASQAATTPGDQNDWRNRFPKTAAALSQSSGSSFQRPESHRAAAGRGPSMLSNPYATPDR